MAEHISITTDPLPKSKDFNFLRREGIREIARLAQDVWTDHNSHDPGITIMEQLCFVMTDLGYKLSFPIKDLLTPKEQDPALKQFFTAEESLAAGAVTRNDYRRLIIDRIQGVKNAWMESVKNPQPAIFMDKGAQRITMIRRESTDRVPIGGVCRILIQAMPGASDGDIADIKEKTATLIHQNRNISEDFSDIIVLGPETISVKGEFDLERGADPEAVMAKIYDGILRYISPPVRFYSMGELLGDGFSMDEIYKGPLLSRGFLPDARLKKNRLRKDLRVSDMIQIILDMPEVKTARNLVISNKENPKKNDWSQWALQLSTGRAPELLDLGSMIESGWMKFYRRGALCPVNAQRAAGWLAKLKDSPKTEANGLKNLPVPVGRDRNPAAYRSVQHEFPAIYGIGETGLPSSAGPKRMGQSRQLAAYLMFFDQIMAQSFAQLEHAKQLLATRRSLKKTYASQTLEDAPGAGDIFTDAYKRDLPDMTEDSDSEKSLDRRHRFSEHLLARMGQTFTDPSMLKMDMKSWLDKKEVFLGNAADMGSNRSLSFDYTAMPSPSPDPYPPASGFMKRIAGLLGMDFKRETDMAGKGADEGFHLVENVLLRPVGIPIVEFLKIGDAKIRCVSVSHGLNTGAAIEIFSSSGFDGAHRTTVINKDQFEIDRPFSAQWSLARRHGIKRFSDDGAGGTLCQSETHGLRDGETVEILIQEESWGKFIVKKADSGRSVFHIERPFSSRLGERPGEWRRVFEIKEFYPADAGATTRCKAADHGLAKGHVVEITAGGEYMGPCRVTATRADGFDIDKIVTGGRPGEWTRIFEITGFRAKPNNGGTDCQCADHGLGQGDRVEIVISGEYAGQLRVIGAGADRFHIDRTLGGKCVRVHPLDKISSDVTYCATASPHGLKAGDAIALFINDMYRGKFTAEIDDEDTFIIHKNMGSARNITWRRVHEINGFSLLKDEKTGIEGALCVCEGHALLVGDVVEIWVGAEFMGHRTVMAADVEKGMFQISKRFKFDVEWKIVSDQVDHKKQGAVVSLAPFVSDSITGVIYTSPEHGLKTGDRIQMRLGSEFKGRFIVTLPDGADKDRFVLAEHPDFDIRWSRSGEKAIPTEFFMGEAVFQVPGHGLLPGNLVSSFTGDESNSGIYRISDAQADKFSAKAVSGVWGRVHNIKGFSQKKIPANKTTDWVYCASSGHGLGLGDRVKIFNSSGCDGEFIVIFRNDDGFVIDKEFKTGGFGSGQWMAMKDIEKFMENRSGGALCVSPGHGIRMGETIQIFYTGGVDAAKKKLSGEYDGEYSVMAADADTFQIDRTFPGIRRYVKTDVDPYSMKVSFIFPAWAGRFAKPEFRDAAADVIRRETPAHVGCRLFWFDKEAMGHFETNHKNWLAQKRASSSTIQVVAETIFDWIK